MDAKNKLQRTTEGLQTQNKAEEGIRKTSEQRKTNGWMEDTWLYKEAYEEMVQNGTLTPHRGNPLGITRSSYWPKRTGMRPDEEGDAAPDTPKEQNNDMTQEEDKRKTANYKNEEGTSTPQYRG